MPRKPNPPPDDKDQAARFVETAKNVGLDESGRLFNKAFEAILPSKTRQKPRKPSK